MARIETYVFLDLETTSLPEIDNNKTRITELSMLAVKREHIADIVAGQLPRVQHKLTMCFNPRKVIDPGATDASGLDNYLLEHETPFNMNVFNAIKSFLECLRKPVCLIAENGHRFDFPILKTHIEKLNVSLPDDVMCADSLHAFYDISKMEKSNRTTTNNSDSIIQGQLIQIIQPSNDDLIFSQMPDNLAEQLEVLCDIIQWAENIIENRSAIIVIKDSVIETVNTGNRPKTDTNGWKIINLTEDRPIYFRNRNENTPTKNNKIRAPKRIKEVRRKIFYKKDGKPAESYKLKDIYKRTVGLPRLIHRAENYCNMVAKISFSKAKQFIKWIDENYCPFSEVKAMRPGVPIGD